MDLNNWNLGKYIAYAVNQPKKYPSRPFLMKEEKKAMTGEQMERMAKRYTIKFGGVVKNATKGT